LQLGPGRLAVCVCGAWHRYRFDKRTANYRAAVVIVSLVLWLG
jgi:hypothetical protein